MRPKINLQKAEEIRVRFRQGEPGKVLAYEFGIQKSTVSAIVNDKIWKKEAETCSE